MKILPMKSYSILQSDFATEVCAVYVLLFGVGRVQANTPLIITMLGEFYSDKLLDRCSPTPYVSARSCTLHTLYR